MNTKSMIDIKSAFGWKANGTADGFEQSHGRYTLEVYWNERTRRWSALVWQTIINEDKVKTPTIIREGDTETLRGAKHMAVSMAADLAKSEAKEK